MLQLYQDFLWQTGDRNLAMPKIEPLLKSEAIDDDDDGSSKKIENEATSQLVAETEVATEAVVEKKPEQEAADNDENADNADNDEDLLFNSFMITIKFKSKDIKLPILVSTFVKLMQQVNENSDRKFDLKKTKYKKVLTFIGINFNLSFKNQLKNFFLFNNNKKQNNRWTLF